MVTPMFLGTTILLVQFAFLGLLLSSVIDMVLATCLEKHYYFYPMTKFKCFCGWTTNLTQVPPFLPIRTHRFLRLKRHTDTCLSWTMNVTINGLTPYFGHMYRADLERHDAGEGFFATPEWHLNWAKTKSKRQRQGLDPWDDTQPV